jgi:AcrR family transcriptional regulator
LEALDLNGDSPALAPARERILEAALRLFYADGVRATGIDRIIAESGVAKMSFYRHFPSKSDLVCAFLEARHERWMAWFNGRVGELSAGEPQALPVVADALAEWFEQPDFRGCAFINVMVETVAIDARERTIAARHKEELLARLVALAERDGLREPHLAGRLALLIVEGAIVRAHMTGAGAQVAADAKQVLAALT